uniref:Uncharacterized protein n=1 Tax=Sphaerodactylus townsendi TaxID=933632 RepID=A0ACB8E573_9SAUR
MESCFGHPRRGQQPPLQQQECEPPLTLANSEASKASNPQSTKVGSYGVSIRVQGIDGHPYVVLNNTEGNSPEPVLASENGQQVTSLALNRGAVDSCSVPELEGGNGEDARGPEHPPAPPRVLQGLKLASTGKGENTGPPFCTWAPQPPSLLNFQRHPELLQPYDPKKNILSMCAFPPSSLSQFKSVADEERPWSPPLKSVTLDKTSLQFAELVKANLKTVDLTKPASDVDLSKQELASAHVSDSPDGMHESLSSSGGSAYTASPPADQETGRCRPDLLPFRRQDSAGSVPNGSRRSSTSSTTPTSAASLYKFFLDDQECAIYADHVNRHENRRYIPFLPGTGRDIDTGSIPAVDQLIEKFDRKAGHPRRGRLGIRSRIHPDDRKRSRSVDSLLPSGLQANSESLAGFSKDLGKSSEHLVQSPQVCLTKLLPPGQKSPSLGKQGVPRTAGKLQVTGKEAHGSCYHSLQRHQQAKLADDSPACKASTLPIQANKREKKMVTSTLLIANRTATPPDLGAKKISVKSFASASNAQVTPDLLKGQQELAHQTNEETAKQILYNYLKEGSTENDDATKRKVNLVFEKIQTLKSRAAGSTQVADNLAEVKTLVEQKEGLEKEISELRRALDLGVKNQQNLKEERDATRAELKELQKGLEEALEEKEAFCKRAEESEEDLRQSIEELFQVKMEREHHQTGTGTCRTNYLRCMMNWTTSTWRRMSRELLIQLRELMQLKQDLQGVPDGQGAAGRRPMEEGEGADRLERGPEGRGVSSHDQEMDGLKEQHARTSAALREDLAEATESCVSPVPSGGQLQPPPQPGARRRISPEPWAEPGVLLCSSM